MQQCERYCAAQSAGTAGHKGYFAAESAGHEYLLSLQVDFKREIYTCSSTLKSVDRYKQICSMTKSSPIDNLVGEARKLGRHRTKKEAIRAALDEYIREAEANADNRTFRQDRLL